MWVPQRQNLASQKVEQQKYSLSEKLKVAYEAGQRHTCWEIEYKLGIPKSTVNRFLQIMKKKKKKWRKS